MNSKTAVNCSYENFRPQLDFLLSVGWGQMTAHITRTSINKRIKKLSGQPEEITISMPSQSINIKIIIAKRTFIRYLIFQQDSATHMMFPSEHNLSPVFTVIPLSQSSVNACCSPVVSSTARLQVPILNILDTTPTSRDLLISSLSCSFGIDIIIAANKKKYAAAKIKEKLDQVDGDSNFFIYSSPYNLEYELDSSAQSALDTETEILYGNEDTFSLVVQPCSTVEYPLYKSFGGGS